MTASIFGNAFKHATPRGIFSANLWFWCIVFLIWSGCGYFSAKVTNLMEPLIYSADCDHLKFLRSGESCAGGLNTTQFQFITMLLTLQISNHCWEHDIWYRRTETNACLARDTSQRETAQFTEPLVNAETLWKHPFEYGADLSIQTNTIYFGEPCSQLRGNDMCISEYCLYKFNLRKPVHQRSEHSSDWMRDCSGCCPSF